MSRAGALRDLVTFQELSIVEDEGGGGEGTWEDFVGPVCCQVVDRRGRERLEAGRLEASFTSLLRVRSSTETRTVTEEHRAVINGVPHQIRTISNPDRSNTWLEMMIERGVAQ